MMSWMLHLLMRPVGRFRGAGTSRARAGATLPAVIVLLGAVLAACGSASPAALPTSPGSSALTTPGPTATPLPTATRELPPATPPTQALIEFLNERVAAVPDDGQTQLQLGLAIMQRIRETADPSLYAAAEKALVASRRLLPDDPLPLVGLGGLQLGRHEFRTALETGKRALEIDPGSVAASNVVVDSLIELGRYDEAFAAAEALAAASPDLSSLARLSYTRELRGDLAGALEAMEDAATSPGLAAENTAFALAQLGQLQRLTGDADAARATYERALALVPAHAPSIAGLGRLSVGEDELVAARGYFERASEILPLPEYVVALGETNEAAGDMAAAHRLYDLARAEVALFKASGVVVDLELSLFEADHGDAVQALKLAEAAYAAAPTVRAADALAWAQHRSGRDGEAWKLAQEALRLGSHEPLLQYHAGAIAATLGESEVARRHLEAALAADPGFSATGAASARAILEALPGIH